MSESEHKAFEAWVLAEYGEEMLCKDRRGYYGELVTQGAYEGWQARAALAAPERDAVGEADQFVRLLCRHFKAIRRDHVDGVPAILRAMGYAATDLLENKAEAEQEGGD